jgi:hypothetical protein
MVGAAASPPRMPTRDSAGQIASQALMSLLREGGQWDDVDDAMATRTRVRSRAFGEMRGWSEVEEGQSLPPRIPQAVSVISHYHLLSPPSAAKGRRCWTARYTNRICLLTSMVLARELVQSLRPPHPRTASLSNPDPSRAGDSRGQGGLCRDESMTLKVQCGPEPV